jgi:glucosamine 6-phosphate synthetase-like amidotransferase/phosphosugar isomerase protein
MCGIFGVISDDKVETYLIKRLADYSKRRGIDSSGLIYNFKSTYQVEKADYKINKLMKSKDWINSSIIFGHSRLITNGLLDNQPVIRENVIVLHNGIITNEQEVWKKIGLQRLLKIDTEIINAISINHIT